MKIRDMTLLVRIAETGSMTQAAQQLHVTPATVSAAVQRIEEALGVRLFERTTRTLNLTDEGQIIVEGCLDILSRWQLAVEEVSTDHKSLDGEVHFSAPADTTYHILKPVIASIARQHPALRIVMHTGDTIQHLHREAIDIAIRYGSLQDSTLTARRLADFPAILVASPTYIKTNGMPKTPAELDAHRCISIQLNRVPMSSWTLFGDDDQHHIPLANALCTDGYLARQWAVDGEGVALKSLFDVIDDLEAGRLVHVLPMYTSGSMPIHVVFPSRRFLSSRVREIDRVVTACFDRRAVRCRTWMSAVL